MKYYFSIRPFAYPITLQNILILQVLYSNSPPHTKWFLACMFKTLIRRAERGGLMIKNWSGCKNYSAENLNRRLRDMQISIAAQCPSMKL